MLYGLIILVVLPERREAGAPVRLSKSKSAGLVLLVLGLLLAVVGIYMHHLGEDIRIERMLGAWPGICWSVGSVMALLSLALIAHTSRS